MKMTHDNWLIMDSILSLIRNKTMHTLADEKKDITFASEKRE